MLNCYFIRNTLFQLIVVCFLSLLLNSADANKRYSDPDGCLSCHALEGLQFIDKEGILRDSTINPSHYYSSLHGSVPCKDCHRKISYYPHKVENGAVDCAESCHINEPSEGVAYTHQPIVEEFEKSAHGTGLTKGFTGGNRLKEDLQQQNPSCRRCHSNDLYIAESQIKQFKEEFKHTDTECGTCHQGDAWRNQFGGHILRRLIGSRWKKLGNNKMCIDCHADTKRMAMVELEDPKTKEDLQQQNPSCRRCHSNDLYIAESQIKQFKEEFKHTDTECGTCHQGDAWRNQFGGHILRRLIGSRWKKLGNNKMCIDCHADTKRMAMVELEDPKTKEKHKADYRWVHAHESYARSLHNRLLVKDIELGASCMDCHAPTERGKFRHNIQRDEDQLSSTHPNNIAQTCAQSSCHEFATNPINTGFVNTDLHDIDQVKIRDLLSISDFNQLQSYWQQSIYPLVIFVLIFTAGCISWLLYGFRDKKQKPLIGSDRFEKVVIGTTTKNKRKRHKPKRGKMLLWLKNHRDKTNKPQAKNKGNTSQ